MPTHHLLSGFTLWGFIGVEDPPEAGIPRLSSAGFHVVETNEPAFSDAGVLQSLKQHGLRLVVQCYPNSVEELRPSLLQARELGAMHVNAHVGSPHLSEEEGAVLLNGLYDAAEAEGVKLLVETHRGRITQDLYRTGRLCCRIERLRLTLDVSHFIVGEERYGPSDDLKPLLDPLLDRVEMIHGRISNGQQIQVDVGDGSGDLPQLYKRFWAEAMRRWRLRSRAGSALVFTPELGPPDYAMRDPATNNELSNRWEQSLVIRKLAEEAWELSKQTGEKLW